MSDQGMDMLMNQNRGGVIPIVGIVVTILIFYFAYKFYRDESKMSFIEKIKFLKRVVKIILVLFVSVLAIVYVYDVIRYFVINEFGFCWSGNYFVACGSRNVWCYALPLLFDLQRIQNFNQ